MNKDIQPNNDPSSGSENQSKMNRRKALKYIGTGAGVLAVGGGTGFYGYRRSLRISSSDAAKLRNVRFVIAGGSIGGITVAARLLRAVPDANVTIIEPKSVHHYQPGYTLVAAGVYKKEDVLFDQESLFLSGMRWVKDYVAAFEPEKNRVKTGSGDYVEY
ncbi:MAG: hypothetical protein EA363_12505, partial [Balneolaceae bacterium]